MLDWLHEKIIINVYYYLVSFGLSAQDVVILKHTNYFKTHHIFSKSKHYPVMVEYTITKPMVTCPTPLKRKDAFKPDPLLPAETNIVKDYVGSGTDRGHMMPAAENLCQTPQIQDECFYMSNMSCSIPLIKCRRLEISRNIRA
jgi:DNA/RNA endonuclease G (NUC1)